jgi:hypothetical protein
MSVVEIEVETEVTTTTTKEVSQDEILMETVETIIEPPSNQHHQHHHHNGTDEDNMNSNSYINPLSILSNVSTTVPHILAVESTVEEEVIIKSDVAAANEDEIIAIKLEVKDEKISTE